VILGLEAPQADKMSAPLFVGRVEGAPWNFPSLNFYFGEKEAVRIDAESIVEVFE